MSNQREILQNLQPKKEFFIGIDSDGCAFDTMEIKQKECFCPNFIRFFELQKISKYARETWEFVNLYSKTRGTNRFLALVETFRLLDLRPEVKSRGMALPDMEVLKKWIKSETKLGNPTLQKYAEIADSEILDKVYAWSVKVNQDIAELVYGMPPFPFVRESLEKLTQKADSIVVSQTPVEALEREWVENKINKYVRVIAGQEFGTKSEHLSFAAKGKYPDNKILMIGDAPGDFEAAMSNGVLFFPVNPGNEEESWERFYKEAMDKFFEGSYAGDYEKKLIDDFNSHLPKNPSW
jgi:phosphoglycolate phosphatase-like HAD superfamily hydrolase